MRLAAIIFVALSAVATPALAQSGLSQSEAVKLLGFDREELISIPVGTYKITPETVGLARMLQGWEKAGFVIIKPADTSTGNVFQDLQHLINDPMSATINVDISPNIDSNILTHDFSNPPKPCIKKGRYTIIDVVRFEKLQITAPDGTPSTAYLMETLVNYEPSKGELMLKPSIFREQNLNRYFDIIFLRNDGFRSHSSRVSWSRLTMLPSNNSIPKAFETLLRARSESSVRDFQMGLPN